MDAFIERSRLGIAIYELGADRLKISGKRGLEKFALEVELRDLSSEVQRLSRRFYRPALFMFAMGAVQAVIAVQLCVQNWIPLGAAIYFADFIGLSAIMAFMVCLRWIPRLEVVRFKNTLGKTAFDVIREKKYADETEAFVEKLRENIRVAKDPGRAARPAAAAAPIADPAMNEHLWKISVALGAIAFVQPAIGPVVHWVGDRELIVTFACCAAGIGFGIGSFLVKERRRFFSLVGAALCFATPLFY